ncbi:MAG: hypothetical protein WCJ03_01725 [Bacteroidales bacterium]
MKTKVIAIALFAMMSLSVSAQYKSVFGSESTSWNQYFQMNSMVWTDSLFVTGDTILNNIPYKVIGFLAGDLNNFNNGFFFLRETSDKTKVYQYFPEKYFPNMTNREFLVMDLNLKVNDSFPIEEEFGSRSIMVDSVFFDKNKSKHIRFSTKIIHLLGVENFEFIEGIGSNLGLFYKGGDFENAAFIHNYLLCTHHNDSIAYYGKLAKGNCSFNIKTGLKEIRDENTISLIINKKSHELIIKSMNENIHNCIISIFNLNGDLVMENKNISLPTTIQLNYSSKKVYILSCQMSNKLICRKIVVL